MKIPGGGQFNSGDVDTLLSRYVLTVVPGLVLVPRPLVLRGHTLRETERPLAFGHTKRVQFLPCIDMIGPLVVCDRATPMVLEPRLYPGAFV